MRHWNSWRLLLLLAFLSLSGGVRAEPHDTRAIEDAARLYAILQQIRHYYVDEIEYEAAVSDAIDAIVAHLDPHSDYLEGARFRQFQENAEGEYAGIGIELAVNHGQLKITGVMPGSPASRAGLQQGDEIVAVDGEPLPEGDEAIESWLARFVGPPGSLLTLAISRIGWSQAYRFELTRELVEIPSIDGRLMDGRLAYIRIYQFTEDTPAQLSERLEAFKLTGVINGLILDLRDNPGGLLDAALAVADMLLDGGEIVSTRGRVADMNAQYFASEGQLLNGCPIVVLINRNSASASEIVAGALQGNARASVVGERSYGKGSVQTLFPVEPGDGALKLTVAHYFTPGGGDIDGRGIIPDRNVANQVVLESALPPILNPLPLRAVVTGKGDNIGRYNQQQDFQLYTAMELLQNPDG